MCKSVKRRPWMLGMALAGVCGLSLAAAAAGPGTTGADVLKVNLGARPNALGGAYSAVGNDVQSLLYNPADLAGAQGSDAVFQHYAAFAEVTYELLGYAQPVEDMGIVGGTLVWRTMPPIDNPGAPDAPVAVNDLVLTVGEGRLWKEWFGGGPAILDRLAVGGAAKIIYSSLREAHAVSLAADLGAVWNSPATWGLPVTVAAGLQNAGAPLRFLEQADPLPLCGRLGVSVVPWDTGRHKGLLTAECLLSVLDSGLTASVGAEYTLAKIIFFRAGYRFENAGNINGPSAGLGVAFMAGTLTFHLDYAYRVTLWDAYDSVDNNHFISLGVHF
ncbi:MAG: PorV/PorQ family protein [Candidatus Firestonebacteria bacterium]|nr:PorV/PorQ family protein [Candidatus Firestonebacteria bacterium]